MTEPRKARVGLLGLMLELYDEAFPDLKPTKAAFAEELVEGLAEFAEVDFPGVVNAREQVDQAVARFEKKGMDLIVVVLLSYTDSLTALPALRRTRLPILVFNTQRLAGVTEKTLFSDIIENHSLPGVQDLTNVLGRVGRSFGMLTGHYKDPVIIETLRDWCEAARVVALLPGTRIGLLGYPFEGMGDFRIDETMLLARLGVEATQVPLGLVAEYARAAPTDEIERQMASDRETFEVDPDVSKVEHEAGARLEWALRRLALEYGLAGFAPNFAAIMEDGRVAGLPFLASCKLLGDGIAIGGEGDAVAATVVAIMAWLTGRATFSETFTADFEHDAIWMNHMSEGNWKLARRDEPVRLVRAEFPKTDPATVNLTFALEPGEVTLVNLATVADGQLKLICAEGEVLDFRVLEEYRTPNFKFRPAMRACDFLTRYSLAGGSHHMALAYGRQAARVEKIGALLGVPAETLATLPPRV